MWTSSKTSNEFLHTGRDCIEGIPPGTIRAAFVLWATQLDQRVFILFHFILFTVYPSVTHLIMKGQQAFGEVTHALMHKHNPYRPGQLGAHLCPAKTMVELITNTSNDVLAVRKRLSLRVCRVCYLGWVTTSTR